MKQLITAIILLFGFQSFAQEDSLSVANDTTEVYVINNKNRVIKVGDDAYAFEFRDMTSINDIHTLHFESGAEFEKFLSTCFRSLEQGVTVVGEKYAINRNRLSKNLIRIDNKHDAYFMLSYDTVEKIQTAFNRTKNPE